MDKIAGFICPFPWMNPTIQPSDSGRMSMTRLFGNQVNASVVFMGSPALLLEEGVEIFWDNRKTELPKLGHPYRSFQLYEIPQPYLTASNRIIKLITLKQGKKIQCSFKFEGAVTPPDINKKGNRQNKKHYEKQSNALFNLISAWVDIVNEILSKGELNSHGYQDNNHLSSGSVTWNNIELLLLEEKERKDEPRMALIVKVAEKMQRILKLIIQNPRNILIRNNQLQRIEKIQEVDNNSLRWIARQPGKTIAEKGGTKQKIMAVVRKKSFDTLENRVLKDFIKRCVDLSFQYINEHNNFDNTKSSRFKSVKKFNILLKKMLREPVFSEIQSIDSTIQPNYVLQSGQYYKELWEWYRKIIRQDYEIDTAWAWQSRLWTNISMILISVIISGLSKKDDDIDIAPIANSHAKFRTEQICGSWFLPESMSGPSRLSYDGRKYIIETISSSDAAEHPICKHLGGSGGHFYFVITDIKTKRRLVIVFWAIHGASALSLPDIKEIAKSATQTLFSLHQDLSLRYDIPKLSGCVLISDLEEGNSNNNDKQSHAEYPEINPKSKGFAIKLPSKPENWQDIMEELQIFFIDILDFITQE
ncbi:MAG: DUF2357 domain-containing protein [Desulfamplus sp.]|nr:DUF2357 domain-containing protein [Desulfamplus sp.]